MKYPNITIHNYSDVFVILYEKNFNKNIIYNDKIKITSNKQIMIDIGNQYILNLKYFTINVAFDSEKETDDK
jgi:hypothetical protein